MRTRLRQFVMTEIFSRGTRTISSGRVGRVSVDLFGAFQVGGSGRLASETARDAQTEKALSSSRIADGEGALIIPYRTEVSLMCLIVVDGRGDVDPRNRASRRRTHVARHVPQTRIADRK